MTRQQQHCACTPNHFLNFSIFICKEKWCETRGLALCLHVQICFDISFLINILIHLVFHFNAYFSLSRRMTVKQCF